MNFIRSALLFFAIASFAPDAFGQAGQVIWTGAAGDDNFETALNWDASTGAVVPNGTSDILVEFNANINQTTVTQSVQNMTIDTEGGFVNIFGTPNTGASTVNLNIGTGRCV